MLTVMVVVSLLVAMVIVMVVMLTVVVVLLVVMVLSFDVLFVVGGIVWGLFFLTHANLPLVSPVVCDPLGCPSWLLAMTMWGLTCTKWIPQAPSGPGKHQPLARMPPMQRLSWRRGLLCFPMFSFS